VIHRWWAINWIMLITWLINGLKEFSSGQRRASFVRCGIASGAVDP
jgi:hypothetical protein